MKRPDELLSPHDLAGYLDVPVKTVDAWRHRGLGPAGFRVGRHLRYRRGDVEELIEGQLEATTESARWAGLESRARSTREEWMARTTVDRLDSSKYRDRYQVRPSGAPLCVTVVAELTIADKDAVFRVRSASHE